jgi:hypothetical protein
MRHCSTGAETRSIFARHCWTGLPVHTGLLTVRSGLDLASASGAGARTGQAHRRHRRLLAVQTDVPADAASLRSSCATVRPELPAGLSGPIVAVGRSALEKSSSSERHHLTGGPAPPLDRGPGWPAQDKIVPVEWWRLAFAIARPTSLCALLRPPVTPMLAKACFGRCRGRVALRRPRFVARLFGSACFREQIFRDGSFELRRRIWLPTCSVAGLLSPGFSQLIIYLNSYLKQLQIPR